MDVVTNLITDEDSRLSFLDRENQDSGSKMKNKKIVEYKGNSCLPTKLFKTMILYKGK